MRRGGPCMNDEMAANVKIKLLSSIRPLEGDEESYEMWLHGSLVERAGTPYLKYEEVQENQTIQTTIKMTSERALIMRSGAIKMRLPLNIEQQEAGHYHNVFGVIPIETKTHDLQFTHLENKGHFIAKYDLIINGASVGKYKLDIEFQEVEA